jgi:hypothetical protein
MPLTLDPVPLQVWNVSFGRYPVKEMAKTYMTCQNTSSDSCNEARAESIFAKLSMSQY